MKNSVTATGISQTTHPCFGRASRYHPRAASPTWSPPNDSAMNSMFVRSCGSPRGVMSMNGEVSPP
jgi:hypothetical protein